MVFAAALLGAVVAFLLQWNDRRLHLALALSTGTLLGAVFIHLLPDLAIVAEEDSHGLGVWVLLGVLMVHLVEAVFLRTTDHDDHHRHRSVGVVTALGVAVHAASAGLGLAALQRGDALGTSLVVAFLSHKAFETFAVGNVFLLARTPKPRMAAMLVGFALITPVTFVVGDRLLSFVGAGWLGIVTAVAAGTFLYVCVAELLPEVFHHREDALLKFGLLGAGVALSTVLETMAH